MIRISVDAKALQMQLKATEEQIHQKIMDTLDYAGLEATNAQRETTPPQSYQDQSGNLRSSTMYVTASGGSVKKIGEAKPVIGTNPSKNSVSAAEAMEIGKGVAEAEVSSTTKPTLVMVAGMNYASYVSDKGRDVLSTARIVAEESIREQLEDLGAR